MGSTLNREKIDWGIHSIITMDGEPFAVMQKWALWSLEMSSYEGGCSLQMLPQGDIKVVPLRDCISEGDQRELAEVVLDE